MLNLLAPKLIANTMASGDSTISHISGLPIRKAISGVAIQQPTASHHCHFCPLIVADTAQAEP